MKQSIISVKGVLSRLAAGKKGLSVYPPVAMIAHRGYSHAFVENTQQAFIGAAKNGSAGVETDVRISKDGVLVLMHDSVACYADGTRLCVAEHSYAELAAKPLLNKKNQEAAYICSFKRYLELCREYGLLCFIELKGSFSDEKIKETFTMAGEVYDLSMCSLQSFQMDNLVRARTMFPMLNVMLTYGMNNKGYSECLEHNFDIDADYKCVSKKMIADFHARGLKVGLWTVNTINALHYCRSLQADYIESDIFGG